MPKRTVPSTFGTTSANSLEPPVSPSPPTLTVPRATSPSAFTSFFSKSARWLGRSKGSSSPKSPNGDLPRPSFSSSRRPTISHPTQPRPMLSVPGAGLAASQSVVDLSSTTSSEQRDDFSNSRKGSGDLRKVSKKTWSRSVDDLSSIASPPPSSSHPELTRINTTTKIKIDKYRNNVSPIIVTSSPEETSFPFPPTTNPAMVVRPGLQSSPSSPVIFPTRAPAPPSQPAAHARSQSYGAHHPSQPKQSHGPVPPTPPLSRMPIDQGRHPTSDKEGPKDKSAGNNAAGFGGLGGFPFHFGNASKVSHHHPSSSAENAVPQSLNHPSHSHSPSQPEMHSASARPASTQQPESVGRPARNSQILHLSGFVNRFALSSKFTSPQISLEKGWKPYKAQLQGTKLYLYKPPADRAAEIKEHFLIGPAPPDLKDAESTLVEEPEAKGSAKQDAEPDSFGRRKRVYWGRGRHADLVVSETGEPEVGTPDALIHEAVFGTTFFQPPSEDVEPRDAEEEWKQFASAILLCLPSRMESRGKFDVELQRCVTYFIQGAEDDQKQVCRERAGWLLQRYVEFQGPFEDHAAWQTVINEGQLTAPTDVLSPPSETSQPTITSSRSFNMPHKPMGSSPFLASAVPLPTSFSANALASRATPNNGPGGGPKGLEGSIFTAETFTRMEARSVAESLKAWHQSQLATSATVPLHVGDLVSPRGVEQEAAISRFSGSDERPHWLTRAVVRQILEPHGGKTSRSERERERSAGDSADASASSAKTSSPTYARAALITRWLAVAEQCRGGGDEAAWRAIMTGLCCTPIARLDKVWRRVEERDRRHLEAWIKGEKGVSSSKRRTPWLGHIRERIEELLESSRTMGGKGRWAVKPMSDAVQNAIRVVQHRVECVEIAIATVNTEGAELQMAQDVPALARFWDGLSSEEPPRVTNINQYLSLSYAVEKRQKGCFAPYFWKPQSSMPTAPALIPLLFPEPLPSITLVDRSALTRGKKESLLGLVATGIEYDETQIRQVTQTSPNPRTGPPVDRMSGAIYVIPPAAVPNEQKARNIAEKDLDETLIRVFDGELIVKISPDLPKSRPTSIIDYTPSSIDAALANDEARPSRNNSIRLSPAGRLDRKGSMARTSRRSSLPSISQRSSLLVPEPVSTEPPVRVTVKSGTLERLVEILVCGLEGVRVSVADDNGEMPLRDGRTRVIKVDRIEFARVWWAVFRSFVTPLVLFELLKKHYASATTRAKAPGSTSHVALQNGTTHAITTDSGDSVEVRLDVLATISHWIRKGGGAQDILDDAELLSSMRTFLSAKDGKTCMVEEVELAKENLLRLFVVQTSRPSLDPPANRDSTGRSPKGFGTKPPSIDVVTPEDLVENLDAMACTVFRGVTEAHMFELADMLEAQMADKVGWFTLRDGQATADDLTIQNIYNHIAAVEPSALVSETTHQDTLNKLLTPSLRSVLRAYATMRDWLISKIAAPGLSLAARQMRIELLLNALVICRSRAPLEAATSTSSDHVDISQPTIRSFVEMVLAATILSPESRAFTRAWQGVAASRAGNLEDVLGLLQHSTPLSSSTKRLTIDLGWLIERMLEIITLPDTLDSEEGHNLVNLDKRRYLFNLIVNAAGLTPRTKRASETERADMERLNNLAREAAHSLPDMRTCREEAYRELTQSASQLAGRKQVRPFHQLVAAQLEKNKRDKYLRERLNKEKKLEQNRTDRRASVLNRAMQPQKQAVAGQKHARNKKSMTGMAAFFRPLSTAFSSSTIHSLDSPRRTVAELDFSTATLKPHLVLNLVGAGIRNFVNDQRPFTFQLDTEEGGHYLLQAVGAADRDKWMKVMQKIAELSALKRLTFLGQSKGKYADMTDYAQNAPADPTGVFGHDLLSILLRESPTGEYIPGVLPRVIELCLNEIEKRGMTELGMYRIAGSRTSSLALRAELNTGRPVDLSVDGDYADIHIMGDVLRQWLRELPEPIFTTKLHENFVDAMKIPDYDDRNSMLRLLLWQLPRPNFDLLKRLFEHLERVTDFEYQNQMTADALAICFNLTLFRPPSMANLGGMQFTLAVVKTCITHFHWLFGETEAEAEADPDAESEGDVQEESGSDVGSGVHSIGEVAETNEPQDSTGPPKS